MKSCLNRIDEKFQSGPDGFEKALPEEPLSAERRSSLKKKNAEDDPLSLFFMHFKLMILIHGNMIGINRRRITHWRESILRSRTAAVLASCDHFFVKKALLKRNIFYILSL